MITHANWYIKIFVNIELLKIVSDDDIEGGFPPINSYQFGLFVSNSIISIT
jgi:hypothetical protein